MLLFTLFVEIFFGVMAFQALVLKQLPQSYFTILALANLAFLVLYRRKIVDDWQFLCQKPLAWLRLQWKEWGEPFLVAAILAIFIRTFFLGPYKIPTGSMIPTFLVHDRIFVDKISYRFHEPKRGDIIVFKFPQDRKKDFVKRLAGLPGEQVEIREGKLYVNESPLEDQPFSEYYYYNHDDWNYGKTGQVITIPPENYFVLGDNSAQSSDSRNWGFVPKKDVVGKAVCIWWPLDRIKLVK